MISRFLCYIFSFSSAVSLLLLLAIFVVWVRSYHVTDRLSSRSSSGLRNIHSRQGHLVFYMLLADWSNQPPSTLGTSYQRDEPGPASSDLSVRHFLSSDIGTSDVFWEHGSFAWWNRRRSDGVIYVMAVAPFWSLAVAAGILPALWVGLRFRRRYRKRSEGICRDCGYDLRATLERCPECGLVVEE